MRLNVYPNMRHSLYVLASTLLTAVNLIISEIGLSRYQLSPPLVAFISNMIGGLFLLIVYWKGADRSIFRRPPILGSLALATLSTYGLATLYNYVAVQQIGAGQSALLGLLETVFIIVLGLIFLKEKLSARGWAAAGLALIGAFVISFDPTALRLTWSAGEFYAVLSALLVAVGIIALRQPLRQLHAGWTSGLLLLSGSVVLGPFLPATVNGPALDLSLTVVALLIGVGILRGLVWMLFNSGVQQIGASAAAVLFLSHAFFTVVLQVVVAALFPNLDLQPPGNLLLSLIGGLFIALGVALWEAQSQRTAQAEASP